MNNKTEKYLLCEHENKQVVSLQDFVNAEQNSLTWYDFLPGDKIWIDGDNSSATAAEISETLLSDKSVINNDLIDLLSIKLINNCPSIQGHKQWEKLSFELSKVMANNLKDSGDRSLRMRTQRLIYYIQSVVSNMAENSAGKFNVSETILEGNKPWDYYQYKDSMWWLSSDSKNVHFKKRGGLTQHWSYGLPTQIDYYDDDYISIGSIYTNGSVITNGGEWQTVEHNFPIVLYYQYESHDYFLDNQGWLWQAMSAKRIKKIANRVHFARFFDGILYVLDNSDFGHVLSYNMDLDKLSRHSVLPVQVCNDLLATEDYYYIVDKQQGSIFKFTRNWEYVTRVLKFGRCYGCLLDPVSIKEFNNRLHVVSWLTSRLTTLDFF